MNSQKKKSIDSETKLAKKPFSAFELVQTAISLCNLYSKNPTIHTPKHYFPHARDILEEAESYLDTDWKSLGANAVIEAFESSDPEHYRAANRRIPFDRLLKPCGEASKGKKTRTRVGPITTIDGLEKAIRRYFSSTESKKIISIGSMSYVQWKHLRESQEKAVKKRASKRVKKSKP